jgi:circadian locomoter output cycles kaput protein
MSKPPTMPPTSTNQQQSHFSQFSLPHTQVSQSSSHHPQIMNQPPIQTQSSLTLHPPPQMIRHHPRAPAPQQIISTPFIDQSQYITAIPMQPVFPATAAVISPIQPTSDYVHSNVVLTSAQNQMHDHLQRKHEELQKIIVQQQDELRRVSEQLFMARYGIIPSIVNVSLPFVAPMDQTEVGESSRCISSTAHLSQSSYHEQQQHMIHSSQITNQHQNIPTIQMQNQSVMHQQQQHHQHPQHIPVQYDMNPQKPSSIDHSMDSGDQQNDDIMQYMQHQTQPLQQQQLIGNDDFELMPFQMSNQQAQILFSSGNNDGSTNSSNK